MNSRHCLKLCMQASMHAGAAGPPRCDGGAGAAGKRVRKLLVLQPKSLTHRDTAATPAGGKVACSGCNTSCPLPATLLHPDAAFARRFLARVAAALEEQQSRSAAAEAAAGPGGGDSWRSNGHGGSSGAAVGAGAEAASPPQGSTLRLGRIERSMTMPPLRGARVLRVLTML